MQFFAENFFGHNSFLSLIENNKVQQLKDYFEKIISENDFSPANIKMIKNKVKDQTKHMTTEDKLRIGFGALADKEGI